MQFTRRSFLATAAAGLAVAAPKKTLPVGLELFSVREALKKDDMDTVRQVAKMGYQVVEFYAPYYSWTPEHTKDMRKLLDDTGLKCLSTHNGMNVFAKDNIQKTIDMNHTLGVKYVVCASAGRPKTLDDWKVVADKLAEGSAALAGAGLRAGYHNHQLEFTALEGKRPIEVIAAGTPKTFMLQLDLGTCVEVKQDPLAWIKANPGRINCMHLKDWGKEKGYKVLFGEGQVPFKEVMAAAQKTGGLEYVLIEQEGSDFSEFETAQKCIDNYKKMFKG